MTNSTSFQPSWVSPPGETIADILKERGMKVNDLSQLLSISIKSCKDLISGNLSIDGGLAEALSERLGSSSRFWLKRQSDYSEQLELSREISRENEEWIKALPYGDLSKYGWVKKTRKQAERITECLSFFGVSSSRDWYSEYDNRLCAVAFRTSSSYDSTPESVLTWLKLGEYEAKHTTVAEWNPDNFNITILKIRELTRIKDPQVFIPKIKDQFAACGVALVIAPTLKGCRASGATYFLNPKTAILQLSFRYLSDDHFWFTLFHEAGHLVLHENEGLFLEGTGCDSTQEEEANLFSEKILIPEEHKEEFKTLSLKNWKRIPRFAKKIGVSNGIIVGQLQHHGLLDHKHLNKLKVRYRWD